MILPDYWKVMYAWKEQVYAGSSLDIVVIGGVLLYDVRRLSARL